MTKTRIPTLFLTLLVCFSLFGMMVVPNSSFNTTSKLTMEEEPHIIPRTSEFDELADDDNTVILCHFEGDLLNTHNGGPAFTNGGWEYNTETPLVGESSVVLAGENRNHIKWEYTPTLSEGTIEVIFTPHEINTDTGADYILESDYNVYAYWGLYLLDDGTIKARHNDESLTNYDLTSNYALIPYQTYHIAYTWGPRGQQIWVNGEIVAENQAVTIAMHSNVHYYGIGNTHTASNTHASWGTYDEFRLSTVQKTAFPYRSAFEDDDATIISYFENNLNDVYGHYPSSNGMTYTNDTFQPVSTPWNEWIDDSVGGDWITFNVTHLGENHTTRLNHVSDVDPEDEIAKALFSFDAPLESPIIETRVALGSNTNGYINFATYSTEGDFLQVVQLRPNGSVRPYNSIVTELEDNITDSTQWLDIRLEIIETSHYDLYINDELVGEHYNNYFLNEGQVAYVGFYGGFLEDDDFEAYCAYVSVESKNSEIEGSFSAVINANSDYARWYDTTDYSQGTVECFFKPSVVPLNDSILYYILNGGDGTYPMIGVYMQNGTLWAYHYSTNHVATPSLQSSTILEPGELYHIAYTFGPSGSHLYINGVDESSSSDTRILHTLHRYIGIGKTYPLTPTTVFSAQGKYDLFRWSSVQRISFPTIADIVEYTPPATHTSTDPQTTSEPIYYEDTFDNGYRWIPLVLVAGGIVALVVLIGPKRRNRAVLLSHVPIRTTQKRPVSARYPREIPLGEPTEVTDVKTVPRKRFCNWCGVPLFDYVGGVHFCPNCGKKL